MRRKPCTDRAAKACIVHASFSKSSLWLVGLHVALSADSVAFRFFGVLCILTTGTTGRWVVVN